ncbi:glycosyltransferase family 4 protein [Terrihabitans sp. B22-R8]|uniref:glycosyltransferase family 4 protein n=1 Tax=Terrihabitans sp. B22-R8 TaxID=3425128 RepID=UPI00403C9C77
MRFITAAAGSRDLYQIPLALQEAGLLERHVTDFYTPDAVLSAFGTFVPKLERRHRSGLPSSAVMSTPAAILRQLRHRRLPLHTFDQLARIDNDIADRVIGLARHSDADLFLYSGAGYHAFRALPDKRRILFQFHPHPRASRQLLAEDVERHPEVTHSFAYELDSQPLERLPTEIVEEWPLASEIICASAFTKHSLTAAGCDPSLIKVVPYGSNPIPGGAARVLEHSRSNRLACHFLFVGQGVQRKGLHHLLKAWMKAGLTDCLLTVVTSRLDPGIRPLTDQANVVMRSGLSGEQLSDAMMSADVFVMPSLVEGFGLVYLEALSAGLHCIGTWNTGLPDLEPSAEAATIIEAGAEDALLAALIQSRDRVAQSGYDRDSIRRFALEHDWPGFREKIRFALGA